jgi:hypothetical protein
MEKRFKTYMEKYSLGTEDLSIGYAWTRFSVSKLDTG